MRFRSLHICSAHRCSILIVLSSLQLLRTVLADHCCSLSRAELEELSRNATVPCLLSSGFSTKLPLWCELCPPEYCRVGDECMCHSRFLDDSDAQFRCNRSFLVPWPESVGREDIFRRICRPDLEPVSTNNTSCCSLTENELNVQRSTHVACFVTKPFQIKDSCHPCPPGTCRLGSECYCPRAFENEHALECSGTFGASWPDSVGRDDPDLQGCEGSIEDYPLPTLTPNFALSSESCCSIPEAEMNAVIDSVTENCPSNAFALTLDSVCGACPPDTCRVGRVCVCPEYFQRSGLLHTICRDSFGDRWPGSVNKEDSFRKNCNLSNTSCCSLEEDELNELIESNGDCLSASPFPLADRCTSTCPEGTCRVKDQCFCIEDFKEEQSDACAEDFGEPWPSSAGMEDMGLKVCESRAKISSSPTPSVSSSVAPAVSTTSDSVVDSASAASSTDSAAEGTSEGGLSGVELTGTIAGVVSTVIAVVATAAGFFKWRSSQRRRKAHGEREALDDNDADDGQSSP